MRVDIFWVSIFGTLSCFMETASADECGLTDTNTPSTCLTKGENLVCARCSSTDTSSTPYTCQDKSVLRGDVPCDYIDNDLQETAHYTPGSGGGGTANICPPWRGVDYESQPGSNGLEGDECITCTSASHPLSYDSYKTCKPGVGLVCARCARRLTADVKYKCHAPSVLQMGIPCEYVEDVDGDYKYVTVNIENETPLINRSVTLTELVTQIVNTIINPDRGEQPMRE